MYVTKYILSFCLTAIVFSFLSCSDSTSFQIKNLTDYKNQYDLIYIYEREIFTIKSDGTNLRQITNLTKSIYEITVNNYESRIAFACASSGEPSEIYVMNRDGSEIKKISSNTGNHCANPNFLNSGDAVVYWCDGKLHRVNLAGNEYYQITPDSIDIPSHFSYSISEDKIVFDGWTNTYRYLVMFIMNIDGTELSLIPKTNISNGIAFSNPVFSKSGNQIVFTGTENESSEIYIINADGTGLKNLSNSTNIDDYANWYHNDSKIYFESYKQNSGTFLYTINSDGSLIKQITYKPFFMYFWSTISPDNSRLSFTLDTNSDDIKDTIIIVDIESGQEMKLTEGAISPLWVN